MYQLRILFFTFASVAVLAPTLVSAAQVNCNVSAFKRECDEDLLQPHTPASRKEIKLKGVSITKELRAPDDQLPSAAHCKADFGIAYLQMNDKVRVETSIDSSTCGAASGEFTLQIRTYVETDSGSESVTRDVVEQWRRESNEPLELSKDYPIAENTEQTADSTRLGWVRVKSNPATACICAAADAGD